MQIMFRILSSAVKKLKFYHLNVCCKYLLISWSNIRFEANSVRGPSSLVRSYSTLLDQESQQMTKFFVIGALKRSSAILLLCFLESVR